jgi:hypothetical protein
MLSLTTNREKMNIDDKINRYLQKLYEDDDYTMFASELYDEDHYMVNVPHTIDRMMISKGLIERDHDARMLTEAGIKISEFGGWKHYLVVKAQEEERESNAQSQREALEKRDLELSIREKEVNFFQVKYWWVVLLITTIASTGLSLLFSYFFKI